MQTINVPEKITRYFCGADLYSCVRWSTDKIFTSFESTTAATKAVHLPILFKICQFFPRFAGFAGTTDSRERYLKGAPGAARARSKPAGP